MASPEDLWHPCLVCWKDASKQCSRCKKARYCKQEHSDADWKRHKSECDYLVKGGPDTKRRSVQAILFPADGDAPRPVKVDYKFQPDPDVSYVLRHKWDWHPWFKETPSVKTIRRYDDSYMPTSGHALFLVYNDNFFNDGSPLNRSVQKLTSGKCHPWGGHMLGFRGREPIEVLAHFEDPNLREDLPEFVNFFRQYGMGPNRPARPDQLSLSFF
ncbi:hypothetical protein BKA93DRAFT_825409 [Sparassis latifolia]|uniref:MYND-type domain-containing protein n=1 Tax=Sparassis crispa TaxID=139825 RepID=A0A401G649_9APHY|nr:hypothetical protein SCP_0105140 [Sparassis crispa]GBE77634.1 hypothetical protein SCP_0105140 [Sparassis crispa]